MEASADDSDAGTMVLPVMTTVSTQTDDYDIEEDDDDSHYIDLQSEDAMQEIYEKRHHGDEIFLDSGDVSLDAGGINQVTVQGFEDDICRPIEFEYEEVTIFRTNVEQKIGLTLCYGSANDEITDIFVSEVDPQSLAGVDGRIKEGDQILQINGLDVHTRQHAVRIFADSGSTITLLLVRPTPAQQVSARTMTTVDLESQISVLNEEMKRIRLQYQDFMSSHQTERHPPELTDAARSPRVVPRMGTRLDQIRQQHTTPLDPTELERTHGDSKPLYHLSRRRHESQYFDRRRSPGRDQQRRAASVDDSLRGVSTSSVLEKHEDSGAALHRLISKPSHSDLEQQVSGGYADGAQKEWSSDGDGRVINLGDVAAEDPREGNADSLQTLYDQYVEVMYTNKANLHHTIMVQQNLFQQQWLAKQNSLRFKSEDGEASGQVKSSFTSQCSSGDSLGLDALPFQPPTSKVPAAVTAAAAGSEVQMEWVVKRRADGSRYITRRPIRSRILKERARKLAEERCGLTTDDDAMSELKVGRYWSKEERKRHLEKARSHRRQKEMLMKQQMEGTRESDDVRTEGVLLEVGHRKTARHRERKIPEDVSTVVESISHGSRDSKTYNPFLSVTTV